MSGIKKALGLGNNSVMDMSSTKGTLGSSRGRPKGGKRPRTNKGKHNLHKLAQDGHQDKISLILESESSSSKRQAVIKMEDQQGVNILFHAIRGNHLELVTYLLEQLGKKDIHMTDPEGSGVLHYAAKRVRGKDTDENEVAAMIELLYKHGADLMALDKYESSPLHIATIHDNMAAAKYLLELAERQSGEEMIEKMLKLPDARGSTPMHEAATYHRVEMAEWFFQVSKEKEVNIDDQVWCPDAEELTPLHLATAEADFEMTKLLISNTSESMRDMVVNFVDSDGNTALVYAIEKRCKEIVDYLLGQGARATGFESTTTVLHVACKVGYVEVVESLLHAGAEVDLLSTDDDEATPLHKAIEYLNVDVVRFLLNWKPTKAAIDEALDYHDDDGNVLVDKAMLYVTDDENFSPLLTACCYDDIEILKLLLDKGSDVRLQDNMERNAVAICCAFDQNTTLKALLQHLQEKHMLKPQIQMPERDGNTPLHICAQNGFIDCAKTLIRFGAKIDNKNEDEETAFLVAVTTGSLEMCELLLDKSHGDCINDEDEDSHTALHIAAREGHLDICKLLVAAGVDKINKDVKKKTSIDYAAEFGHTDIVNFLISVDVPIQPLDVESNTPLHLACLNGHVSVVQTLLDNGADVKIRSKDGLNVLDMAIEKNHSQVASVIIQSQQWRGALMNQVEPWANGSKRRERDTPFRKLIKKMPEVAKQVLDRCIHIKHGNTQSTSLKDLDLAVNFNYEFMDDTYMHFDVEYENVLQFNEDQYNYDLPNEWAEPYNTSSSYIKYNHPLSFMVRYRREDLLMHPLVLSLISRKWRCAGLFYALFFVFYIVFLTLLSVQIVRVNPVIAGTQNCTSQSQDNDRYDVIPYMLYVCSIIGIGIELFQLGATKEKYLTTFSNVMDWFTYVSTILVITDFSGCDRTNFITSWQWQLGAFDLFFAWINFILFLQRFPNIGIYVVMVTEIFITFFKFFAVFFLFILTFALCFYVLLQNQEPFSAPEKALVKTWVMMLGEMDFATVFFGRTPGDPSTYVFYWESTMFLFVCFLVILAVILQNLLTGLAVDDVNQLQENAKVKKMALQIDLALDVEIAMTRRMLRRWKSGLRCETFRVYDNASRMTRAMRAIIAFLEPSLSRQYFVETAVTGEDTVAEEDPIDELEGRLTRRLHSQECKIDHMYMKLKGIEQLLLKRHDGSKPVVTGRRSSRHPGVPILFESMDGERDDMV